MERYITPVCIECIYRKNIYRDTFFDYNGTLFLKFLICVKYFFDFSEFRIPLKSHCNNIVQL